MQQSSTIVVKFPGDTREVQVDFSDVFTTSEMILAGAITHLDPASPLTATVLAVSSPIVAIEINGGVDYQSYGINVTVNTNTAKIHTKVVSVIVNSNLSHDYQTKNVDAFNDLVGGLEAGSAGMGYVSFMFPLPFDSTGGNIKWELLDSDGIIYSSGFAHSFDFTNLSTDIKIIGSAVINSPSDMVPTLAGQNYQVRWTLTIGASKYYSFENIVITGPNTTPEGVEDVIELVFNDIPVSIIFDTPYENVTFEVYQENQIVIPPVPVNSGVKTPDGYLYAGLINSPINMPASLEAYTVVWTGWNQINPAGKVRQTGRIFVVNPSIMSAVNDMRVMINKAATTIAHRKDLLFTPPLLLAYLRRGRDSFNGTQGVLTGFDMTNASGSIREFWLRYAEVMALRAQFLAEGEKVFNFSGQAISLDVDRTGFYSGLADTMQSAIDAEIKPFKQNLVIKGHLAGDGNLGPFNGVAQARGAAGAIGITLTPATGWGKFTARYGIR